METITISNIDITVIRKAIRNIHLAVNPPSGNVTIAVPLNVNDDTIRLFIISKISWIRRQQRKFSAQARITAREYKQRESHYFLGRRYLLSIKETSGKSAILIKNFKTLELHTKAGASKEKKHEILSEWYRKELKKIAGEIIPKWEKKIGVKVLDFRIKLMKTKWGSCNKEKQRIWLNLELAKKPVECIEYIVVHEMLHLLERHHNERFRQLMDMYLPNWRHLRSELNRLPVGHSEWKY